MLYFEEATGKRFNIETYSDLVKYMYVSATVYNDIDITLDEFADCITQKDVERFSKEFNGGEEKKKKVLTVLQRFLKSLLSLH